MELKSSEEVLNGYRNDDLITNLHSQLLCSELS